MDYIYILAWERMMGSFPYFVAMQIAQAQADGAPDTAIYKSSDGTWHTFDDIQCADVKREIHAIVERMDATK